MKAQVINGELLLGRINSVTGKVAFRPMHCPYTGGMRQCAEWCPLFGEVDALAVPPRIRICNAKIFEIEIEG